MFSPSTLTEALAAGSSDVKMLLVAPAPVNDRTRLEPEAELREIYGILNQLRVSIDVIRLNPPTVSNFRIALATRRFNLIHVATHVSADGIEFEKDDGTADRISVTQFAELFTNYREALLVLNGCSIEPFGEEIARVAPALTFIGVGGAIRRRDALDVISSIYGLVISGVPPEGVVKGAAESLRGNGLSNLILVRGRKADKPIFSLEVGGGRPVYYSCMPHINMPPRRLPIFDREHELLSLHVALFQGSHPIVGIVGITGTGKTTLVQAVISRYGWRFSDGICYISLRADLALPDIAEKLGWNTSAEISEREIIAKLSDGRYLLIFDDAEDVAGSALTDILRLLSEWDMSVGSRALLVLHTRRREFSDVIANNWVVVKELPPDAALDLLESRLGSKKEAQRTIGSDLAVVPDLTHGHPKTIESTASLLQLGQRWSELKDDLIRLSGAGPLSVNNEMMARVIHRLEANEPTVKDLLDAWSVMEDRCQELVWKRIAAGEPQFESHREAWDAGLRALQGALLIERYYDGVARCVIHPLFVSHLRRRHATLSEEKIGTFVRLQLDAQRSLAASDRFPAEESGNIRRVLHLADVLELWPEIVDYCQYVAGDPDLPLVRRGPWQLARDILDLAYKASRALQSRLDEARFLLVRGMVEYRLAEFGQAETVYSTAADLAELIGEHNLRLDAMRGIGRVRYRRGDFDGAERIYLLAKDVDVEVDPITLAEVDHELAKVLYRKNDLNGARNLFSQSLEIRRSHGSRRQLARSLHELARVEHAAKNFDRARTLYTEALDLERRNLDPVTEQATLYQLGLLAMDCGDIGQAREWLAASRAITRRLSDQVWLVHADYGDVLLLWAQGERREAIRRGREVLESSRVLGIGLTAEIQRWLMSVEVSEDASDG